METDDIRYCVDFIYKGPSSDFYIREERKFFSKQDDVCVFLVKIRDNVDHCRHISKPIVFDCRFSQLGIGSVIGMVESYEKRIEINDSYVEQEKKDALSKLSIREKKLLGL